MRVLISNVYNSHYGRVSRHSYPIPYNLHGGASKPKIFSTEVTPILRQDYIIWKILWHSDETTIFKPAETAAARERLRKHAIFQA
jgi:hypothetical protein